MAAPAPAMTAEEEAKQALLAEAEAAVGRLRAWRDECRTGGQVSVRRIAAYCVGSMGIPCRSNIQTLTPPTILCQNTTTTNNNNTIIRRPKRGCWPRSGTGPAASSSA